jgi:hypothetical protein
MSGTQTLVAATAGTPVVTPVADVQFNSLVVIPTIGSFNTSSYTYTLGTRGLYSIEVSLCNTNNASVFSALKVNGSIVDYGTSGNSLYLSGAGPIIARGHLSLTAGDTVKIELQNGNSGTALSIASPSKMTITKL